MVLWKLRPSIILSFFTVNHVLPMPARTRKSNHLNCMATSHGLAPAMRCGVPRSATWHRWAQPPHLPERETNNRRSHGKLSGLQSGGLPHPATLSFQKADATHPDGRSENADLHHDQPHWNPIQSPHQRNDG